MNFYSSYYEKSLEREATKEAFITVLLITIFGVIGGFLLSYIINI